MGLPVMIGRAGKRKKWKPGKDRQLELFETVLIEEFWWSLRESKRRQLAEKFQVRDLKNVLSSERLKTHLKTLMKLEGSRKS
jgi:hypothetical protein